MFSSLAMVGHFNLNFQNLLLIYMGLLATAGPPIFSVSNTTIVSPEQPLVIAVVDLDPPTPQNTSLAQIRHFLGGNYFASETGELTNTTAAISEFLQPSPPNGSEPHR